MKRSNLKQLWRIILLVFALTFCFGLANGLAFELPLRHYTNDEGLAQNDVNLGYQDQLGYLWFGTFAGISRFDGKSFTNFTIANNGLDGDIVKCILEDSNFNLWICHNEGVARWNGTRFETELPKKSLLGKDVFQVVPDPHKGLWIVTEAAVNYFNGENVKTYPIENIKAGNARYLAITAQGVVYMLADGKILMLKPNHDQFVALPNIAVNGISLYYNDSLNTLEVIDSRKLYTLQNEIWMQVAEMPAEEELINFTHGANNVLWLHGESTIWKWQPNSSLLYQNEELQNVSISSLYEDREGNLWISRWGRGISLLINEGVQNLYGMASGYVVTGILPASDGKIWLAGEKGATVLDNSWHPIKSFESNYVNNIVEIQKIIYVATNKGVLPFDLEGNPLPTIEGYFTYMMQDSAGTVWLASSEGMNILKDGVVMPVINTEGGLGSNNIWIVHEDSQKNLWVGTEAGLSLLQNGEWQHFTVKQGVSHESIWDIIDHPYWGVLFATQKGITQYKDGKFSNLDILSELTSNTMAVDAENNLWVGTEMGLYRVTAEKKINLMLNKARGLSSNAASIHAIHLTEQYIYLGTYGGLSRVELNWQNQKNQVPRIHFNQAIVNQKLIAFAALQTPLPHNSQQMTFHFKAPYFYLPDQVFYQTQLEGFEENWNQPTTINQVSYTNLHPGKYKLHIKALAEDGKTSEHMIQEFELLKPFWMEWWFFVLEGLLSLVAVSGIVQYFIHHTRLKEEVEKARLREQKAQADQLYQRQLQLDKLKDEFLANTSHELRTPLNGIIGLSEAVIDGACGPLNPEQMQNIKLIAQSGRRLSNLVNDILDFSKMKNKDLQLQLKNVDIRGVVDIVMSFSKTQIGTKPLKLFNHLTSHLPLVLADENRLQQILFNLVGNAIKFTAQGAVTVAASLEEDKLKISVQDTGIGIPADRFDQVFRPFEQADGSTAREYGGTGLGLSITREFVELHGGKIWLESTVNQGSTFHFTLPIAQGQEVVLEAFKAEQRQSIQILSMADKLAGKSITSGAEIPSAKDLTKEQMDKSEEGQTNESQVHENTPSTAQAAANIAEGQMSSGNQTILIIDDEPINLQVLKNQLQLHKYRVLSAQDGMQALEILDQEIPDIVLLDLMMPRMSGYEVCQKIREHHNASKLPIIMLTAKNQVNDLVTGLSFGANDYLIKPFNKDELLTRIKSHLKLSHMSRAFERFVPHEFLELLNKDSIMDVQIGDCVKRKMSVLFADIRSFTALSESLTPEENFHFLNSYLKRMEPPILEHNGFIDKFIGDAIMALFHQKADDAVKGGIAMLEALRTYNLHRQRRNFQPIEIGIGINTGDLMLGTIGGMQRMESTVISDAVNLASRIEGITKLYKTPLLIGEETMLQLENPGQFAMRFIDRVLVKGKARAVSVFEVFEADLPAIKAKKLATKNIFEKGWMEYQNEHFQPALDLFQECYMNNPMDTVANIYVDRCKKALLTGQSSQMSGATQMDFK